MSKLLVKTNTVITAKANPEGLQISLFSPEIGELHENQEKIMEFLWSNGESLNGVAAFSREDLVKYFLSTSEDYKKAVYSKIFQNSHFWVNLFHFIKNKYPCKISHDFVVDKQSYVFHRNVINLYALTNKGIKNGESYVYPNIFNKQLVQESIIPIFKFYAMGIIRTFNLA